MPTGQALGRPHRNPQAQEKAARIAANLAAKEAERQANLAAKEAQKEEAARVKVHQCSCPSLPSPHPLCLSTSPRVAFATAFCRAVSTHPHGSSHPRLSSRQVQKIEELAQQRVCPRHFTVWGRA